MKNKFFLALLTVAFLLAAVWLGVEQAGVFGGIVAIFGVTTTLSWLFSDVRNQQAMRGQLFAAIGAMRPLKRGESNLSGVLYILIYTENQLTAGSNFPSRAKGEISGTIPIVTSETAARWTFDVGTGKGDFKSSGPITNTTYKHMLEGKVAGMFQEQLDSLDDLYNTGCIAVAVLANGKRMVYGSTRAPLFLLVDGTTADKPEADGKGMTLKFENIVACDHPPRQLATSVVVTEATLAAYPTQVTGVTP
jgi:hypothetical protein